MTSSIFRFSLTTLSLIFCLNAPSFAANSEDPDVVSTVDLQKYAGKWYNIARSPNFFQKGCLRSEATYQVLDSTSMSVYNQCTKADGEFSNIAGIAKINDANAPTKLTVKFGYLPQRGSYWITELDPDYQWAVVSGPHKKSIFILSRTAPMDGVLLEKIVKTLEAKGYRTDNLIYDLY